MTLRLTPARRWRRALALGCAVLATLVGCGGGTTQYEAFVPERLIVFGDETSALTDSGHKYSINGTTTVTDGSGTVEQFNCQALPNWVQSLAGLYGFVFAQCNPTGTDVLNALNFAVAGAMADDVKTQVDQLVANGGFRGKDLVTVLAGANDVIDLYRQFPGRTEEDLSNELRARGRRLALQVNRVIDLGGKVILSTVPDMGTSPYALKQKGEFDDTDRAALLTRLTAAFNEQLGVNILLDGRYVGLVQADLRVQAMVRSPPSFGLSNVSTGACLDSAPVPDCSVLTLNPGAVATEYLWADDTRLAYPAQAQIAALAVDRARRNPF